MSKQLATVAFVGDLMLGRGISAAAETRAPTAFWGDVLPILRGADAVIGNLESPITASTTEWRRCWKAFRFGAHPRTVELLTAANVRAVTLANNHILDRRGRGLCDTLCHLDAARICHAGAGRHLEEAATPAVLDLDGVRIGIIALTDTMPEFAAGPRRPGTNYMRIARSGAGLALVARLVRELRRDGADLVVLSAHWGPNLRPWPPARYRAFARAAIDLGVDVFHGHSAHIFQGVESHGNGLILYDTGDILDDYWIFPFIRTDWSFVFLVDLSGGRPTRLRMVPVILERSALRCARPSEATTLARSMQRRSRPFGTQLQGADSGVELRLPAAVQARPEQWRGLGRRLAVAR